MFNEPLKHLPAFFNAAGLKVQQLEATSKDGTRIPYFVVARENLAMTGEMNVIRITATSAPTKDEVKAAVSAAPARPFCASG